jgi:hypothetical protein
MYDEQTEANMRTVKITLHGADFASAMAEMRTWLDQRMFEPARFTYKQDKEIVVISVDFENDRDGEAFQRRFERVTA